VGIHSSHSKDTEGTVVDKRESEEEMPDFKGDS
jgi:hypothetical protein